MTPFSPRALDRGLTGTLISQVRLSDSTLNPNESAQDLSSSSHHSIVSAKSALSSRAHQITVSPERAHFTENTTASRVDNWLRESSKPGRRLGYEMKQGDIAGLLKKPGTGAWEWNTVAMSMREVEPGVRLVMDDAKESNQPDWQIRVNGNKEADNE